MKNVYEHFVQLGLNGLEEYFQQEQEETEHIEYKSGELPYTGLFKEVCAFANTDGGIIIYGAPKEIDVVSQPTIPSKKEKRKVCKGNLCPTKEDKSPDSLIQILMTNITPAINGLKVCKFVHLEGFVYIFYIPQSINSPHQVAGRYFIRVGTMSEPAPHGIVQALFNKKKPIDLSFKVSAGKADGENNNIAYGLQIAVTNKSDYPAHNVEGLIILVGYIGEKGKTQNPFQVEMLGEKTMRLTKNITFPNSLVLNLWTWYNTNNLCVWGEYFYLQVYIWAKDTPGIYMAYKIHKEEGIRILDPVNTPEDLEELKQWTMPKKDD